MTRRDYVLIASVLANTARVERTSRVLLAVSFADALVSTNPRFDRGRFLAAALDNDEVELEMAEREAARR